MWAMLHARNLPHCQIAPLIPVLGSAFDKRSPETKTRVCSALGVATAEGPDVQVRWRGSMGQHANESPDVFTVACSSRLCRLLAWCHD